MLDGVTLDQLRTFVAAVEYGSFSSAGRALGRAQSVVSQAIANLEGQLRVTLFDRSTRPATLTDAGKALIVEARQATAGVDALKQQARILAGGLEAELSVVIDVMFPISVLTEAVADFSELFPSVTLRLYVEALGAVLEPVLSGRCILGVAGSLPVFPPAITTLRLREIPMLAVAAVHHPLVSSKKMLPAEALKDHIQLVLTDRSDLSNGREFGVFAAKSWRLADLGAKHAFLKAGLGWGAMPLDVIQDDLDQKRLAPLNVEGMHEPQYLRMSAIHRTDRQPGPAGRWLIDRLAKG